ncbi:MAG: hypothetical protein IJJ71_01605 [Treponema sp.]|nr:hypothetical protein [Treponema sp.]
MNNQIMRYGGTTELGVYGVVATVMSLFQALFGGVGQAIQPLVSANHGAGNAGRNRSFFRMGLLTVAIMGIAFCALGEFFPAATRRDCRRMGRAAACRIRDGGSCRGSAAQDAVRGRKTPFGTTSPPAAEFRQEPLTVDARLRSDGGKFLSFLFHVFPRHSPRICRISHTSPHSAH